LIIFLLSARLEGSCPARARQPGARQPGARRHELLRTPAGHRPRLGPADPQRQPSTPRIDSGDLDADLRQLTGDPLYFRDRDPDYVDHVTRQFERIHGPDGPAPGPDGRRRGTLEVPRLRRRPGDHRLKRPVGRGGANDPDDVARLQRALSETGDYAFAAPRERSGVMSPNLETAVLRYQRRTGLDPDGYVVPDGPTIQRVNGEAAETAATPPLPARKPGSDVRPAGRDERRTIGATRAERVDPAYQRTEADLLLGEISRTRTDIARKEAEIETMAEDIEAERERRRRILIETTKDASPMASKIPKVLGLHPLARAAIAGAEVGAAVSDLPADIGEMRNIPHRVERWEKDLDSLRQDREALLEKLDRLETERGKTYPRHVPPFKPRRR
jgi:peptidoglycan hydrolase-like protein with peptidoglycan-binding domain